MDSPTPHPPDHKHPIIAFDGAITTTLLPPSPTRDLAFAFHVTFDLQHPHLIRLASTKPPLHFHPYQEEYIRVIEGRLGVEIEGRELVLKSEDEEVVVKPWEHHRLYPILGRGEGGEIEGSHDGNFCRFLLSGEQTQEAYGLDTVFFQNWYGYQDEVVMRGGGLKRIDLMQVMCMFDAGGSYLSLPHWVPLGKSLARMLGIVVGRWIGGILGYQPYHRQWTTDWELACRKMGTSVLQRRFVGKDAKVE